MFEDREVLYFVTRHPAKPLKQLLTEERSFWRKNPAEQSRHQNLTDDSFDWSESVLFILQFTLKNKITVHFNGKTKFQTVYLSRIENQRTSNAIVENL
jgi:hypothetical protein